MGAFQSKVKLKPSTIKNELRNRSDPLGNVLPPLYSNVKSGRRSLYNASSSSERLNIIKKRMSAPPMGRQKRNDFESKETKSQQTQPAKYVTNVFPTLEYDYSEKLSFVLEPSSEWGMYQHDPSLLPFEGFQPGLIMDLETCYSNDQGPNINLMKSYIQQIGACGIGNDMGEFNIACLLPTHSTKTGLNIPVPTSAESFENILSALEQTPKQSMNGYKKVLGMNNISDEKLVRVYQKSWVFWEDKKVTTFDNPLEEIRKWKKIYGRDTSYPLLFRIKDALRLFLAYCGENPVWYAHNGHRFDFIIMEKWFRVFDLNFYCEADVYPPKKTTAMNYLRTRATGPNYSVFSEKGYQIGKSKWLTVGKKKIRCFDTIKLFKNKKNSLKSGAQRVSQGAYKKVHLTTELGGTSKTVYQWEDGSSTSSLYSHKQQDLITAVGIKGNSETAHTALYDCLTLRELIYRAFNSATPEKKLEGSERDSAMKSAILTKRMKAIGLS